MNLLAILHTHSSPETTRDTINSIQTYLTQDILLVVDAVGWDQFKKFDDVNLLKGFYHNYHKANYRNVILGLLTAAKTKYDYYVQLEYDVLIGSNKIKDELTTPWLIGADFRDNQQVDLKLLELMLRLEFKEKFYLLGAFLCFSRVFIEKLAEIDFFERFLYYTNDFKRGFFPGYTAHDLSEQMYPSLARHLGGQVKQLDFGDTYPIRWRPDLENSYFNASILHPLKGVDHPLRQFYRRKRHDISR